MQAHLLCPLPFPLQLCNGSGREGWSSRKSRCDAVPLKAVPSLLPTNKQRVGLWGHPGLWGYPE